MRDYDRDEYDDEYDDYYEDEEQERGDEYEEEEGDEYEEKEPPKPTKEQLEYLGLRQRLKESIRKQMKKDSSASSLSDSSARGKKLPNDNFGSFFGPSQPVIAQRVIQESKSLLENQHLTPRPSNSSHINKTTNKVSNGGLKPSAQNHPPKVSEKQVKAQKLKNTRDYSFLLSDDVELPAPTKNPPSQNTSLRYSEGRQAQIAGKTRQPLVNARKPVRGSVEDPKLVSRGGHLPPKSGSGYKLSSTTMPSKASADSRKHLGSSGGNGPGRLVGTKSLPSKGPGGAPVSKSSTPGVRNPVNSMQKPPPSKVHASIPKQSLEQRKDPPEQHKPKMLPKQPVASSKPQIHKPLKQNPKYSDSQDHRPKNKPVKRRADDVEDEMDIRKMIRSMFNYNPNKFADDDDDDDMEAGFDEILKEERRSALIAKKEDDEQLRLIEEEAERERRRRMSKLKKRRVG